MKTVEEIKFQMFKTREKLNRLYYDLAIEKMNQLGFTVGHKCNFGYYTGKYFVGAIDVTLLYFSNDPNIRVDWKIHPSELELENCDLDFFVRKLNRFKTY